MFARSWVQGTAQTVRSEQKFDLVDF